MDGKLHVVAAGIGLGFFALGRLCCAAPSASAQLELGRTQVTIDETKQQVVMPQSDFSPKSGSSTKNKVLDDLHVELSASGGEVSGTEVDEATQGRLDTIDREINMLHIPYAAALLNNLATELSDDEKSFHGYINTLDTLGQCQLFLDQLGDAFAVYDTLVLAVESRGESDCSELYGAGYAIRECGVPENFGKDHVDQYLGVRRHIEVYKDTGEIPDEWKKFRQTYLLGKTLGVATKMLLSSRFDAAASLLAEAVPDPSKLDLNDLVWFWLIYGQVHVGRCEIEQAITQFTNIIESFNHNTVDPEGRATLLDALRENDPNSHQILAEAYTHRATLNHFQNLEPELVADDITVIQQLHGWDNYKARQGDYYLLCKKFLTFDQQYVALIRCSVL
jgi:hypothetical protein